MKSINLKQSAAAVLAISAVVFGLSPAISQAKGDGMHGMMGHGSQRGDHGGGMHEGKRMEHMLDQVKATPEQRSQIAAINKRHQDEMKKQHEAMKGEGKNPHHDMMQALSQPTVDMAAIERLRQQEVARHDQMSKQRVAHMAEVAQVLTPEQRKQLADMQQARTEKRQKHMDGKKAH